MSNARKCGSEPFSCKKALITDKALEYSSGLTESPTPAGLLPFQNDASITLRLLFYGYCYQGYLTFSGNFTQHFIDRHLISDEFAE